MRVAVAMVMAFAAGPAVAQGSDAATRRAHEEAQRYLRICLTSDPEDRSYCEASRVSFVRNYQAAKAGDYQGQRNVSAMLAARGSIDVTPGVEPNRLQSCAWGMVVLQSGHSRADDSDVAFARARCGAPQVDRAAAEARARAIVAEIRREPARMPSADPRATPAQGALDGTAHPLRR